MFRPNPAIIRFISKGYQRFVTTMGLCKDGEISSSGYNYVIIKNLVGEGEFSKVGLCCHGLWCFHRYLFLCSCPMRGIRLVVSFHRCQRQWVLAIGVCGKGKTRKMKCVLQISDTFGWKPDDGRIRPKHVVLYFHPLINIVRNTCCVIDSIPVPIIHTQNGDDTFQTYSCCL